MEQPKVRVRITEEMVDAAMTMFAYEMIKEAKVSPVSSTADLINRRIISQDNRRFFRASLEAAAKQAMLEVTNSRKVRNG